MAVGSPSSRAEQRRKHLVTVLPGVGAIGEDITELPGHGATAEQMAMLHTRYRLAGELAAGKDVLELACGPGIGLGHLAKAARWVVGGDLDPSNIEAARESYHDRIETKTLDAQDLPYPDDFFDVVLLLEAIYFLPDPRKCLSEARRVLRKDGTMLISTANCERPDFNPSPYATQYFRARELKALMNQAGFDVELLGAFPTAASEWRERVLTVLRKAAVAWRLIPTSMKWKIRLKRMLFGKLQTIPPVLTVDDAQCRPCVHLDANGRASEYKVLYAIGQRIA